MSKIPLFIYQNTLENALIYDKMNIINITKTSLMVPFRIKYAEYNRAKSVFKIWIHIEDFRLQIERDYLSRYIQEKCWKCFFSFQGKHTIRKIKSSKFWKLSTNWFFLSVCHVTVFKKKQNKSLPNLDWDFHKKKDPRLKAKLNLFYFNLGKKPVILTEPFLKQ